MHRPVCYGDVYLGLYAQPTMEQFCGTFSDDSAQTKSGGRLFPGNPDRQSKQSEPKPIGYWHHSVQIEVLDFVFISSGLLRLRS